jgi:hypothetical protein
VSGQADAVALHRCELCGVVLPTREKLATHDRFEKCRLPATSADPIDEAGLEEIELRNRVRRRLQEIRGATSP